MALTKINSSVIANNTIAVGNIADNSVDATKIASNSILTRHIDDNQIGIDQLNVSDGSNGQALTTNGSGTLAFSTISSTPTSISDADSDTKIQVEESSDEDKIRFDTGGTERMIIDNAGKVGIGTTSPVLDLQVGSATSSVDANLFLAAGTNAYSRLYMGDATTGTGLYAGLLMYDHGNDVMSLFTSSTQRVTIDSSGKVGIRDTSPDAVLKVNSTGGGSELAFKVADNSDNMVFEVQGGGRSHFNYGPVLIGSTTDIMHANMDDLQVGHTTGSKGITIASGSDSYGTLAFGDGATGNEAYRGFVEYYHNDDSMRLGSGGAERVRIDSSGSLGVGTNNPGSLLHVAHSNGGVNPTARIENTTGTVATNSVLLDLKFSGDDSFSNCDYVKFQDSSGEEGVITGDGGGRVYYEINSDYRLKENILNYAGGLDKIKALSVKKYNYKTRPGTTYTGFLAHEVAEVVDGVARGTKDAVNPDGTPDYQGMDLSKLVPDLVSAIQEQQTIIDNLKSRIETLEG